MIPIYLKKRTIKKLNEGEVYLKQKQAKLEVDDLLMYNLAKQEYIIDKNYKIEKGDKVVVKYDKNKEIDYNDVLSKLNTKEQIFYILYNSINYVNEKFGITAYLNEDLAYILAYIPEENLSKYGRFITKEERKQFEQDYGYDRVLTKQGTTLGTFEFHNQALYIKIHRQALSLKNNPKIKEANRKLVEYFVGDIEEIKNLCIKTLVDTIKYTNNEKIRVEALKLAGNWFGVENNTQQAQVDVILQSINASEALQKEDEF